MLLEAVIYINNSNADQHFHVDHRSSQVIVDGWIRIKATGQCAAILFNLRERMESVLQARVQKNQSTVHDETTPIMDLVASLLEQEYSS